VRTPDCDLVRPRCWERWQDPSHCWAVSAIRRGTIGKAQRIHPCASAAPAPRAWNGELRSARIDHFRRARPPRRRQRRPLSARRRSLPSKGQPCLPFAPSNVDDRGARSRPAGNQVSDAASPGTAPVSSSGRCGNVAADAAADALIERIERAVEPTASQRDALEQLRTAVAQVIERINAPCPAVAAATFAQRLTAIQDRIWVMHDALLTLRLPFETFNNTLTDDQQRRLRGDASGFAQREANATGGRAQTCADPAAGTADGIMRAIERAARSAGQQRAGLDALRLNSAAMAKLVAGSCPADPFLAPMGRFAAATDRLDVMLFAVMSMSPALQQLYDSLGDKQKAGLNRALRQTRQSGP